MKNGYRDPTGEVACGNVDREYRTKIKLARQMFRDKPGWDGDKYLLKRLGFTGIFAGIPEEVAMDISSERQKENT